MIFVCLFFSLQLLIIFLVLFHVEFLCATGTFFSGFFGVLCVSYTLINVFFRLEKFSSVSLLKTVSVPLTWVFSSSIPIFCRTVLFILSQNSWIFLIEHFFDQGIYFLYLVFSVSNSLFHFLCFVGEACLWGSCSSFWTSLFPYSFQFGFSLWIQFWLSVLE